MFSALSEALGAPADPSPGLYLSVEELHRIARQGFSIGAHGATHAPFSALDQAGLESELDSIARSFAQHHLPSPRAFAFPDAAFSEDAERAIASRGYRAGLLLGDQVATPNPLRLSRFIVPDEPRWVEQVLLPALGVRI
jgi:peptidoglycan/xylan/chitin deacetylase (PgdA/CDA1 family)